MKSAGIIIIFGAGFLLTVMQMTRGTDSSVCVRTGGVYLGRSAIIMFRKGILRAAVVPKLLSGKVLISDPMWDFYFTKNSFWGRVMSESGADPGGVFWRSDLGLVYQRDDPQRYEKLVKAAGPPNAGLRKEALGPEVVYDMLIEQGAEMVPCKTRLLAW